MKPINDFYYNVFLTISSHLTGYSEMALQSTGQSDQYYSHILKSIESITFLEFLRISKKIIDISDNKKELKINIMKELMSNNDMKVITKKIITLWYMGYWNGDYLSSLSYIEGLVWKTMKSHPPGAKQPGFKSWSIPPLKTKY